MTLSAISPGSGFPWSTVVELQITYPDNKHAVGSGVMIDNYHVLTAGHVVYSSADGGFASTILATPELNGTSAPFGSAYMTHETTYNAFIAYDKAHPGSTAPGDMDIALFSLNKTIGNNSGWMSYGYNNNNNNFSAGSILNTAGYPASNGYNGLQEEFSSGSIAGLSSDGSAIEYYQSSITTYGGQSGSPVWEYLPSTNTRVVYGIHVGGYGTPTSENFATRITQSIYNDIGSWISQDNAVRHPSVAGMAGTAGIASTASALVTPSTVVPSISDPVPLIPLATTTGNGIVVLGMTVPTMKALKPSALLLDA